MVGLFVAVPHGVLGGRLGLGWRRSQDRGLLFQRLKGTAAK